MGVDGDCGPSCGDGTVTPGRETCDSGPGSPTPCPSSDSCKSSGCSGAAYSGKAGDCTAKCDRFTITERKTGDGCCPSGANMGVDGDCGPSCGDGIVTPGRETCDSGPGSPTPCPSSDSCKSSGCSGATWSGSAGDCTAKCDRFTITQLKNGDGCCPGENWNTSDTDCPQDPWQ